MFDFLIFSGQDIENGFIWLFGFKFISTLVGLFNA